MQRRDFLIRSLAAGGAALAAAPPLRAHTEPSAGPSGDDLSDWAAVRAQFELTPDVAHFALFFLASHPKPVRDAIERHRRGFDADPVGYFHAHVQEAGQDLETAASEYLGVSATDIAFTDSTTMGLGLIYGGLELKPGQEILTTFHDHYSTEMSLRYRAERTGTTLRQIALYGGGADATVDGVVGAILKALTPRSRIVAVTWVHSCTGVKLPIRAIADELAAVNARRGADDRVLLCVDGVHGLATDDVTLPDLGCDFFMAGTHKWLYGPRGTGIVWGRPEAWAAARPIIPPFNGEAFGMWMRLIEPRPIPPGPLMTPGGFHSFEHRWALSEAFRFHERIGKGRVAARIHALNRRLKEGLAAMPRVTLHTPMSDDLSAGIVCFEVEGMAPDQVVDRLAARRIHGSTTPYATSYARLAPCILNTEDEVDRALRAVADL